MGVTLNLARVHVCATFMTVEVKRVAAHDGEWMVPYFWTSGPDYNEFETTAANDPSIRELTKLERSEIRRELVL
jgi:hypothetical protein